MTSVAEAGTMPSARPAYAATRRLPQGARSAGAVHLLSSGAQRRDGPGGRSVEAGPARQARGQAVLTGAYIPALDKLEAMVEELVGFSRWRLDSGPLQVYLAASELDGVRPAGTSPPIRCAWMAEHLRAKPLVHDLCRVLRAERHVDRHVRRRRPMQWIKSPTRRCAAMRWARSRPMSGYGRSCTAGEITHDQLDASWQSMIALFAGISSENQLFDAARNLLDTAVRGDGQEQRDPRRDGRSAGWPRAADRRGPAGHAAVAARIRSVLSDQRLVTWTRCSQRRPGADGAGQAGELMAVFPGRRAARL